MSALRIAYLLKKFPRLSETFVLNEVLKQESLGQDIHVFSRRSADDEPVHEEFQSLRATVETLPGTHSMNPWGELFAAPKSSVSLDALADLVRSMEPFEHPRMGRLVAEAIHLHRRVRELDIEHIHTHFATDSAVVAMMLRDLGGPKYSITAHAKDIYRTSMDPKLLARMIERSKFTVTVCDANVRHLDSLLPESATAKVRRLYNGIDLEAFQPANTKRDEDHILAVGRLVPKKGFHILLQALAKLQSSGRPFRATLIGEGEERASLEARAHQLGIAEKVHFAGGQTQAAVREQLRRATVFCLPCVIDTDGNRDALPTVLLEALASGIPTVSTPVTGIPEILADGRVGCLVPCGDADATAAAMERLLGSPEERTRLARLGREHVEAHFDARDIARTLHSWLAQPISLAT